MSVHLMSQVFHTSLPATHKLVLLALCDNADEKGEKCFPSVDTLAKKCSLSRRAVFNSLKFLEAEGYIQRDTQIRHSTNYHVGKPTEPCPVEGAPDAQKGARGAQKGAPGALDSACGALDSACGAPVNVNITVSEQCTPPLPPPSQGGDAPPRKTRAAVALPAWLPKDSWDALLAHRRAMRSPMTEQAQRLALKRLEALREQGDDPRQVIDATILNGWRGVFPLKPPPEARQRTRDEERRRVYEAIRSNNEEPEEMSDEDAAIFRIFG